MLSNPWGVILAGGDGTRLKAVTRLISGDSRPKQFCALFGGRSLLARTRARVSRGISPDRVLFVVVRDHERYYLDEFADVDESKVIIQPANRGTTAAFAYSVLRLMRLEEDPLVAFFPADHHYSDESRFSRAVAESFHAVRRHPERLVLIGVPADSPQTEFGWIEPGAPLETGRKGGPGLWGIRQFREKPTAPVAEELMGRGCLWNTFVIAGRAQTFLELMETGAPQIVADLRAVVNSRTPGEEQELAARIYATLPAGDFSHEILSECPERLAVLRMDGAGWRDLGTPEGVLDAIRGSVPAAAPGFSEWLAGYCHHLDRLRRPAGDHDIVK